MIQLNKAHLICICLLATNCVGQDPALEAAVLSFPNIKAHDYRPDQAVKCANVLIKAGKDHALAALTEIATNMPSDQDSESVNRKVCLLCRLVFTPKAQGSLLREPRLGGASGLPYNTLGSTFWPDLPFVIINGIPLSMNLGYAGTGFAERSQNYLSYCRSNGLFRMKPFSLPTSETATKALDQLFGSRAWDALKWKDEGLGWSYSLDEADTKKELREQIRNMRVGGSKDAGIPR